MSDYGLIVGANGNIQFDTRLKLPGLVSHDFASSWTAGDGRDNSCYVCSIASANLLVGVAVRPSTATAVSVLIEPGSGATMYQNGTETIEYAAYSLAAATATNMNWGLVTYDASGNILFSSGVNALKIQGIFDIDRTALQNWNSVTISHPNIANPFYILPYASGYTWYPSTPTTLGIIMRSVGVKKIDATSVSIAWFERGRSGPLVGQGSLVDEEFYIPNPYRLAVCTL